MRKLSDIQGEAAIDFWADLIDPIASIMSDKDIADAYRSGKPKIVIAKDVLKGHKAEATEILLKIDPTPLNAINIITRVVAILSEIEDSEEIKDFFQSAEVKTEDASSTLPTVSTGDEEN